MVALIVCIPLLNDGISPCMRPIVCQTSQKPNKKPKIEDLIEALKSPNTNVRRKTVAALRRRPEAANLAIPVLINALSDSDELVRSNAEAALFAIWEHDTRLIIDGMNSVSHTLDTIRKSVVEAIESAKKAGRAPTALDFNPAVVEVRKLAKVRRTLMKIDKYSVALKKFMTPARKKVMQKKYGKKVEKVLKRSYEASRELFKILEDAKRQYPTAVREMYKTILKEFNKFDSIGE